MILIAILQQVEESDFINYYRRLRKNSQYDGEGQLTRI